MCPTFVVPSGLPTTCPGGIMMRSFYHAGDVNTGIGFWPELRPTLVNQKRNSVFLETLLVDDNNSEYQGFRSFGRFSFCSTCDGSS